MARGLVKRRKVKAVRVSRKSANIADRKYLGDEPTAYHVEDTSSTQYMKVLNWFNYFYIHEELTPSFVKFIQKNQYTEIEKVAVKAAPKDDIDFSVAKRAFLLESGFTFSEELHGDWLQQVQLNLDSIVRKYQYNQASKAQEKPIIDRATIRLHKSLSALDDEIDHWNEPFRDDFNIGKFLADHASTKFNEAALARMNGILEDLADPESQWSMRPSEKREYTQFIKSIRDALIKANERPIKEKIERKPRKLKIKTPEQQVAKVRYCKEYPDLEIKSVSPTQILGASQLWAFHTRSRKLFVYNASDESGFKIQGTKLINMDEKTSICKTLRKPQEQIANMMSSGKIQLRKFMDSIKAVPKNGNGRLDDHLVLLRVVK